MIKISILGVLLLLTQLVAGPPGAVGVKKDNNISVREQMKKNVVETEQNLQDSTIIISKIKKLHEEINVLLEQGEETKLKFRLRAVNKNIQNFKVKIKEELDVKKKSEWQVMLNQLNELKIKIEGSRHEIKND